MSVNCISAYFYGLTHLKIWFYILMYQDGKKNQESNFFIPTCLTENLAQSEVPQRPFSFGSWITKQREGNPSTEKKRTTNKPFYPNPIFIVISFFPRAMDEKNHFQTKEQWKKYHCGSRVYNLPGPPWGKKERNANSVDEDPTNSFSVTEALSNWLRQTCLFYQRNLSWLFPFFPPSIFVIPVSNHFPLQAIDVPRLLKLTHISSDS